VDLDAIGDACTTPSLKHTTVGFFQAGLNGGTTVEPEPVAVADEPTLTRAPRADRPLPPRLGARDRRGGADRPSRRQPE
jgi:hypothetical protein